MWIPLCNCDWTYRILQVGRRASIGIRRLDHANLERLLQPCLSDEVADEPRGKCGDLVTVQKPEFAFRLDLAANGTRMVSTGRRVVEHDSIGVSIEGACSLSRLEDVRHDRRQALTGLDIISSTAAVQGSSIVDIGADQFDR